MKIEQIINDILELRKELQRKAQTYLYDIDYISIFDNQLNAKAKALQAYLKVNNFTEYYNLLELLIPIKNNAIEFVETFISIKDEILEYSKYNNPQSRLKLINDLAYHMQEIYVRTEIDCIFASLNIKCGDEYYTFNSKRIYVQNVLQNATTMQLIKLAKSENLLMETIDLKEEISEDNTENKEKSSITNSRNISNTTDKPIFEILGIKLFLDDLIIIGVMYFLYQQHVHDEMLYLILFMLLFS